MMTKNIIHSILKKIHVGAIKITYWNGETIKYGTGTPYCHVTVTTAAAGRKLLKNMSLGFGEGYMDGTIKVKGALEGPMRLLAENMDSFKRLEATDKLNLRNRNTKRKQSKQIKHHYDIGNDFYKLWLDKSMTYTCAYFKSPKDSLEKAQKQKLEHVLRKLQLQKGQKLLDIGCGWGALLIKAAQEYGVSGLGVTLSQEQHRHATTAAKRAGVDHLVSFELANYLDLPKRDLQFDRIVSVGMFEAVGRKNLKDYYKVIDKLLVPGGISVLHTITQEREVRTNPWIDKYIFPGGYIPSVREVVSALPNYNFRMIDYENLRMHYATTLDHWHKNFVKQKTAVLKMHDERFYRMWELYLVSSEASFRYWDNSLSQFVFTKGLNNKLPLTREFLYK